ncbi:MAG TPA: hypothetical protein VN706_07990 [Gemmatimonadaceae bacterium]|nr:hypothetical protein [Gemmatimonadaceae bacterium]
MSRRLCELEAEWLIRFGDVHGDSAIRSLAIQPWVNIGRLDALEGNWAGALSRYAGLSSTSPCSALVVLGHSIEIDDAVTADAPVTLRQMANNIYVLDSLQALLRNHQAGEMLEFVERLSPTCGREFQPFLREAAIVAHAELGRADEAVHLARSAAATVSGWPMLVFRLRLAETLAVGDNMSSSRAVLTPIASVVPRVSLEAVRDLSNLRILQRAATVAAVLCWPEAASALARVVFDGASTAGDEPLCIESARLLSTVDSTDVARWTETRQRLEEETMYRQYRSGDVVAASDAVLEAEALVAEICSS